MKHKDYKLIYNYCNSHNSNDELCLENNEEEIVDERKITTEWIIEEINLIDTNR